MRSFPIAVLSHEQQDIEFQSLLCYTIIPINKYAACAGQNNQKDNNFLKNMNGCSLRRAVAMGRSSWISEFPWRA